MKIKVAKYIEEFLAELGIKDCFTITGGGAMHLNDAFGHSTAIKCTYNHHEQACAMAAEAYARLTGQTPVVCVTSGPGGTNALTGVLGAWLDSIPMIVVSGQVKRSTTIWSTDVPLRQLGDQEYNITDCVQHMTKYAVMITDEKMIAYHLEKATYLCKTGRPGPVWIDVPLDIQGAIIEPAELVHFEPLRENLVSTPKVDDETINEIIERIKIAKKPVILAGSGIRLSGSHGEFLQLVDKLEIPVVTAWNAHDNISDSHEMFCGRPSTLGTRGGNFVVQNSDLLISLGCRLNIRQISYNWENFANNAYKIVVDIDAAELQKPTISPDIPVHADVKDVINKLLTNNYRPEAAQFSAWLQWCKEMNDKYPVALSTYYLQETPLNPYVFMEKLFDKLLENEIIVASNGSACVTSFQAAKLKEGQRLFTNSGCASMGYGLPAAIGTAIAKPDKRIICLEGDGSIQMNIQELQTVIHNNLNIKIFWLNNNGYHSIRQTQKNIFQPPLCGVNADNGVSFPSAEKIAYAYGISYVKLDKLSTLENSIELAINSPGPVICEVIIDPEQNFEPKLSSKILPDGTMISPPLDDMYPFIDAHEYRENIDRLAFLCKES